MLKRTPVYVLLFAVYPSLALLSENIREVEASVVLRPAAASILLVTAAYLAFRLILRDTCRAALAATLFTVLFFSYGHVYQALEPHAVLGVSIGRHRYLLPIYLCLFCAGLWWLTRRLKSSGSITQALNVASIAALAMPVLSIGAFQLSLTRSTQAAIDLTSSVQALSRTPETPLPDVYYIILDTYSRQDIIERWYGYDNEPFLDDLRHMGFVVAECSRSNYGATQTSLASSLNLAYLPEIAGRLSKPELGKDDYSSLIKQSTVRSSLSRLGYRTVAFETGFEWTRVTDADYYLGPGRDALDLQRLGEYEALFVKTTAILALTDARQKYLNPYADLVNYPYQDHIERQLLILDQLPEVASIPEPTFTFAHVLIPHPPHVFAPDGSIEPDPGFYRGRLGGGISDEYSRIGYVHEVQFVNRRVLGIVETILAESTTPPIIVIQGDTGVYRSGDDSGLLSILNAYYLPDGGGEAIYPSITPVNTFRVIFDLYFGTSYGLLPDQSPGGDPIPETSAACLPGPDQDAQP
jgi:hypothetical protein